MFDDSLGLQPALLSASQEDYAALHEGGGFAPAGTPELRAELAETLTARGLPTEPDELCITSGGQQALWLLASLLARRGHPVVVEDPTWSGGLDAIRSVGTQLVTVPVDQFGVVVPELAELVERVRPSMVLVAPEYQNPTGARMHEVRRAATARLSAQYRVPVVEDFCLWGLGTGSESAEFASLARYEPGAEIITFGSLTKLFWRGLRVGWIRAPQPLVGRLAKLKAVVDGGTPVVSQLAAARALRDLDEIRSQRAAHVETAMDVVTDWAATLEPGWTFERPSGGLSVWMQLPQGSAVELSQVALRHGVEVWPGPVFSATEGFADHLRIPLGRPLDRLGQGLARLGEAWRSYVGVHPSAVPGPAGTVTRLG